MLINSFHNSIKEEVARKMLEKEQSQRKAIDTKIKKKEKRKKKISLSSCLKIFSRSNFNKYRIKFASKPTFLRNRSSQNLEAKVCAQGYLKYPANTVHQILPGSYSHCLPGLDAMAKTNCITSSSTSASNHWASRGFEAGRKAIFSGTNGPE